MSEPTPASDATLMDINGIMRVLPHRYPFLLIDRIVEHKPKERIVALKNVTMNEPFFAGHFEGYPIMPGVLVVEAMAQAGGVLLMSAIADPESKLLFFAGIEGHIAELRAAGFAAVDCPWQEPPRAILAAAR